MSSLMPCFIRHPSGQLVMRTSVRDPQVLSHNTKCPPHGKLLKMAKAAAVSACEDRKASHLEVLGQVRCQFGKYRWATFLWMVQNRLGHTARLVNRLEKEAPSASSLSIHKHQLKMYLLSFPEGIEAVEMMKQKLRAKYAVKVPPKAVSGPSSPRKSMTVDPSDSSSSTCTVMSSQILAESDPSCDPVSATMDPSIVSVMATPQFVVYDVQLSSQTEEEEEELAHGADAMAFGNENDDFPLPEGWRKSLKPADHQWISEALFCWSEKIEPELDMNKVDRVWYHPPPPILHHPQTPPHPARYFARHLCLWMPVKLWQCRLVCPKAECRDSVLTQCGLYHTVRQVLDVDGFYNLAGEYLECPSCKGKQISWSLPMLHQLDLGHRLQFPAVLTYHYACDLRVVTLVRQQGSGDGPMQLMKELREQHSAVWLQQTALYLTDVKASYAATEHGMVTEPRIQEPPKMDDVPMLQWLLSVYATDVLERLLEVKAAITSIFGSVLKMDSTNIKKIIKKLSGKAAWSAAWVTSVGNEHGQVLTSVLTSHEENSLRSMQEGLVKRYADANVPPPKVLYVDRDCCSNTGNTLQMAWPDLLVRLDAWHFMRRIASGVTTDSHQLYKFFLGGLSRAIFQWDQDDLALLKEAKKEEMMSAGITDPGSDDILRRISRDELTLHCRRRTRGVEEMQCRIQRLLKAYSSDYGRDALGVRLLDADRIWTIWCEQEKHLGCLQDPAGVSLYAETGTTTKGGVTLKTYRCARGSTSLESFHLHLNRYIPGCIAQDVHLQAYLLDGLTRWNQGHAADVAPSISTEEPWSYSARIRHEVNLLAKEVLHHPTVPCSVLPQQYTGELIGVEYLYGRTTALDDSDALDSLVLREETDPAPDDEGFDDEDDQTVMSAQIAWSDEPLADPESKVDQLLLMPPHISSPASSEPDLLPADLETKPSSLEPAMLKIQLEQEMSTSESPDLIPATLETKPSSLEPPALNIQLKQEMSTSESPDLIPATLETKPSSLEPPALKIQLKQEMSTSELPAVVPVSMETKSSSLEAPVLKIEVEQQVSTSESPDVLPADLETAPSTLQPTVLETLLEQQPSLLESALTALSASTASPEVTVDVENIPGFDKVLVLADYLVSLKDKSALTSADAGQVILLYQQLDDYDKRPVVFPSCHQQSLSEGWCPRLKAVESVQQSVVGKVSAAQSPSFSRIVEAIVRKLYDQCPSGLAYEGKCCNRWNDIVRAYSRIRLLVLDCPAVMKQTGIQLLEINQRTLIQWHDGRMKNQEQKALESSIPLPPTKNTASCPPANQPLKTLQTSSAQKVTVHLPENTAGQANFERLQPPPPSPPPPPPPPPSSAVPLQVVQTSSGQPVVIVPQVQGLQSPAVIRLTQVGSGAAQPPLVSQRPGSNFPSIAPKPSVEPQYFTVDPKTGLLIPKSFNHLHAARRSTNLPGSRSLVEPQHFTVDPKTGLLIPKSFNHLHAARRSTNLPPGSRTTAWRRKRAQEENPLHVVKPRKVSSCSQCGKERGSDHKQYYGQWWCPDNSALSFEEWMHKQKEARPIKKRKNSYAVSTATPTYGLIPQNVQLSL